MNSILKYSVPAADSFDVDMPEGAQILSVQIQPVHGQPYIWACGRANNPMRETRSFRLVPTGQTFPESVFAGAREAAMQAGVALLYIGTFQITNEERPMVFHLFEQLVARDPAIHFETATVCSHCGRRSVSISAGTVCDMPQPDGRRCDGTFGEIKIAKTPSS